MLGLGAGAADASVPQLVRALQAKRSRRAWRLACGWQHTVVVTHAKEVFAWGANGCGQARFSFSCHLIFLVLVLVLVPNQIDEQRV